ncbi:MAG: molybdenum cofactor guanylyltransferase MobA [Rhodocyclales bacterium RIFCSPLOWO2_02_FULL_63_24]|nr:MAG: molybdenum cofactor guanylyltransferase MobA [Rhodocyclales bacterium GWA2_65_19]OHC68816.1 MAG: molybdenum cofactor guanylyltransferase MobA [Rhodocyclales bacterium RIFCSPLOWO2_02_FULL_63_24]
MSQAITGVILAGGLGRRMGGVDKGLQLLRGRPMVQWVLERLAPQVDTVLISANRNLEQYGEFGCTVLPDTIADFAGPLAGLHAALGVATTPLVATVPCDSPYLPTDLVARLAAGLHAADAELAVARDAERAHPVFCLASRELLPRLTAYLAAGERRLARWHETLRTVEVSFDEPGAFANFNTPEDLAARHNDDVPESQ